jgi:hypothetical protein
MARDNKARNEHRIEKKKVAKSNRDNVVSKFQIESGWSPETHLYVGKGAAVFNLKPTPNVKQVKYGELCGRLAADALLTDPINTSMAMKFKIFRMKCWGNDEGKSKIKPNEFCAPNMKAAKWDFVLEYLQQSRGIQVTKLPNIKYKGVGEYSTSARLINGDFDNVPLIAFTHIPKAPRVESHYHVVAIKGGHVYDCDNDVAVPIADYPHLVFAKIVYVLTPKYQN